MAEPVGDGCVASTSAPVVFRKGRAGKRRNRAAGLDEDEQTTKIAKAKPDLKGAIQVSNASASRHDNEFYVGKGELQAEGDGGATRNLEENTEHHRDRRALQEAAMADESTDDGKYRGMKNYKDWRGVRSATNCPRLQDVQPLLSERGFRAPRACACRVREAWFALGVQGRGGLLFDGAICAVRGRSACRRSGESAPLPSTARSVFRSSCEQPFVWTTSQTFVRTTRRQDFARTVTRASSCTIAATTSRAGKLNGCALLSRLPACALLTGTCHADVLRSTMQSVGYCRRTDARSELASLPHHDLYQHHP